MTHDAMKHFVESKGKWAVHLSMSVLAASHVVFQQQSSIREAALLESLVCHLPVPWGSPSMSNTVPKSINLPK